MFSRHTAADLPVLFSRASFLARLLDLQPCMWTLLVILLALSILAAPAWPYSRRWGYYPSSGIGLVLVMVLLFVLMRRT